ncbi:hypothetical protein LOTGIDRAFT_236277 [Lottia gigantea]|uniref:Uncharacterized protein n=1 Tax=Lottia gigantea TaxID=225164 RepID=V4B6X0_LOTGI|nr:hypothetical protein LOTGIDRAFT_236277 [Lottia gigantea]ESO84294.1 hypothetical protein LOTGIDRAFT_236277 [Lottia gigantea]
METPLRLLLLSLLLVLVCSTSNVVSESTDELVARLLAKVEDSQVTKAKKFFPVLEWQEDLGVYKSEVKLYFHGPEDLALIRDKFHVFDNNMFVTSWVSSCLLEAYRYGGAPKPSPTHLKLALDSINGYRNKDRKFENSIMSFWPQAYNSTSNTYISTPVNLLKLIDLTNDVPFGVIENILKFLGFGDISSIIKTLLSMKDTFRTAFHIPPDFDDTFVNLGLGSLLTSLKTQFPEQHSSWMTSNTNLTSVFDALKKYAYRPFSKDSNVNTIDPRTYFYLRKFMEKSSSDGWDLALTPTWIQDIEETTKLRKKGISMPFNINNVDVTVSANVIYGITSSVLSGVVSPSILNDTGIQQILLNTTNMIAHECQNDLSDRRDLALTYYPSVLEFYWFVARTVFILNENAKHNQLPHEALYKVLHKLEPVLEKHVTSVILKGAKSDGADRLYLEDFLGNGDFDKNNHTLIKGEDRIFTTSMGVNALIATWSIFDGKTSKLYWKSDTPTDVKSSVTKFIDWLKKYTLSGDFKPYNTFFSGSAKGEGTLPFYYPINRLEYLNGTNIPDETHFPTGGPFTLGVQGTIPKAQYDKMLTEKHFGVPTPTTFKGFNSGSTQDFFPFWSSEPYTYATTMLALAQSNNFAN